MSERDYWYSQNSEKERQERHDHDDGQSERKDYGHINERVEETDSTKNPPKER